MANVTPVGASHQCNLGLARFKEDPNLFRNAIAYLAKGVE